MHNGVYVFYQLINSLSRYTFQQCVDAYRGDSYVKSFPSWQQFLCLAFGQLTFRESLRSITVCLNAHPKKLYHLGFRSPIKRSTLAYANEQRDWRIYQAFGYALIKKARKLCHHGTTFLDELNGTFYALDSTTIELCLSVFQWAQFRAYKGAVKMHTLLDLRGALPSFIHITDGTVHDVNALDVMPIERGACYIMDRGYVDYGRLFRIHQGGAFFITRAKRNMRFVRMYSRPADKKAGVRCDQTIRFTGAEAVNNYPATLRRIKYRDAETRNTYVFLTNNFDLGARTIADLYKRRWDIEQFFRWIKGHLNIRVFWGQSQNAVKTQLWVAICTYVMVVIIKQQLQTDRSMYEILQILSTTALDKIPLDKLFFQRSFPDFEPMTEIQAKLPGF